MFQEEMEHKGVSKMDLKNKKILCVCMYGQSRSVYFANKLKEDYKADTKAVGWCDEASTVMTIEHIRWAELIIVLDKDFHYHSEQSNLVDSEMEANALLKYVNMSCDDNCADKKERYKETIEELSLWNEYKDGKET